MNFGSDKTKNDDDDDDDDDDNDNSSDDSNDDTDDDDEDSDDSSAWTSSGEVFDDEEEEWNTESEASRRPSAAAVRHDRRFQNLNEFELTPKEKQWFVNCQKQHNSLIANIPEIKPIIGQDLFDDNIIKSWKSFQHKKLHKAYKKP